MGNSLVRCRLFFYRFHIHLADNKYIQIIIIMIFSHPINATVLLPYEYQMAAMPAKTARQA